MKNILLVNPREQVGYSIANCVKTLCNKLIAVSDSRIPKFLCYSNLYDYHYRLPFPTNSWDKGSTELTNSLEEERYINDLLNLCHDRKITTIFPGLDQDIYLLSKNKLRFSHSGVEVIVPEFEHYLKLADKHSVIELARKNNFPCGNSFLCSTQNDIINAVKTLGYPLVIKKRFSLGTDGVRLIYNSTELQNCLDEFKKDQAVLILQEYIPGNQERSLNILIGKNGFIPIAFTLKKVRYLRPSLSTAIEIVENPPEMDMAKQMLKNLGCEGFYVFQTKVDNHDGKHKIIEINSRLGANFRILSQFGVNIPELIINPPQQQNQPISHFLPGTRGVALFEDLLVPFVYLAHRLQQKLSKNTCADNNPPSLVQLIKSYVNFYSKKPIADIYFANLFKDPVATLAYYGYILITLKQKGVKRLRFIPWGDLL